MAVAKRQAEEGPDNVPVPPAKPARASRSKAVDPRLLGASNRLAPGVVGARLRARREALGISLRQFARDIDVSASFISQLETGKAQPSVATFFSICAALDTSVDELFATEEPVAVTSPEGDQSPTDAANNTWRSVDAEVGVVSAHHQSEESSSLVVHPDERKVLVLDSGVTWESLTSSPHGRTDFMFVRYDVGGSSTLEGRLIRHAGTEYGFILQGSLEITVGFATYVVNAGDAICFDSSRPHRLRNCGDVPVEAIWVNLSYRGQ